MLECTERSELLNLQAHGLRELDVTNIEDTLKLLHSPQTYHYVEGAELNHVLLFQAADPPYVIKYPMLRTPSGYYRGFSQLDTSIRHEMDALCLIDEYRKSAPVEVPSLINGVDDTLAISYIAGTVLDVEGVRNFTEEEKTDLGVSVARFIFWLSDTASIKRYQEETRAQPFNRQDELKSIHFRARELDEKNQYTLAEVSERIHREYRRLRIQGLLQNTIIGHEDLRPANWVFDESDPQYRRLKGIIDFGNTQPSTPEREMRHLVYVGRTAVKAAVQEYQALTGTQPSEHLIWFWARVQTTILAIYGGPLNNFRYVRATELRKRLETVWPNFSWGEITNDYSYASD